MVFDLAPLLFKQYDTTSWKEGTDIPFTINLQIDAGETRKSLTKTRHYIEFM